MKSSKRIPRAGLLPCFTLALGVAWALPGAAQSVAWAGGMGDRALLVIDGRAQVMGAGSVAGGVRVLRVSASAVDYEVDGVRLRLSPGASGPVVLGEGVSGGSASLVLRAGADQLYHVDCKVNGRATAGVVDSGASQVSMSLARAAALGIDYSRGRPTSIQTANGSVRGWAIRLERLAVGSLELRDVDAVVLDADLPHLLVGNSFLRRFRVTSQDGQITLARSN